jgi:V-type H+-transporting ATPase subunit C
LSQKSLSGIVKRENVILDSEYLETIVIAVPRYPVQYTNPRNEEKSFNAKYESLTQNVVPRSSQKLAQDDEFSLYTVTLFRRDIPEFTHRCRELKLASFDCVYIDGSPETSNTATPNSAARPRNITKQVKSKRNYGYTHHSQLIQNELVRTAKSAFSDTFQAWTHLRAIRIYVESVLRYGLPPEFVSAIIKVFSLLAPLTSG